MKKIGLVGGTGPESTLMYYKELNTRIDQLTGGKAMPDLAIESVDFRKAWAYVSNGEKDNLADYLSEKVSCLKSTGCEVISLTAGTMHLVINEIEKKTGVSLVSIPKAVADEASSKGYTKVGLLGTIFTMEQDYMKKDLIDAGIEVCPPKRRQRTCRQAHLRRTRAGHRQRGNTQRVPGSHLQNEERAGHPGSDPRLHRASPPPQ